MTENVIELPLLSVKFPLQKARSAPTSAVIRLRFIPSRFPEPEMKEISKRFPIASAAALWFHCTDAESCSSCVRYKRSNVFIQFDFGVPITTHVTPCDTAEHANPCDVSAEFVNSAVKTGFLSPRMFLHVTSPPVSKSLSPQD